MIDENNTVRCRAHHGTQLGSKAWKQGEQTSLMWMPGGVSTINAGYNSKGIALTVECDEGTATAAQASLAEWQRQFPQRQVFCDFEHLEREASCHPVRFEWRDDPAPGVYVVAVPTARGAEHVNGRIHRAFSPSFLTDAEYERAVDSDGVMRFPAYVRGSAENPARIIGIAFCCGSLTNKPAFKSIEPVTARQASPGELPTVEAVFARLEAQRSAATAALIAITARAEQ